jgi:hypothetical protein
MSIYATLSYLVADDVRCNQRTGEDPLADPNAAPVMGPDGQLLQPANAHFNRPIDFWEIALRLCLRADASERSGLTRLIQEARPPPGYDPHAILAWMTTRLAPALMRRADRGEDNQVVQDAFLEVVRSRPDVIQTLYTSSLDDEDLLNAGVESTLSQSRVQQRADALNLRQQVQLERELESARRGRGGHPTLAITENNPEPHPRVIQRTVGGFERPAVQTTRGAFQVLFGGNNFNNPNAIDVPNAVENHIANRNANRTANPPNTGRNFSLTDIWRQMANRPAPAPLDPNAPRPQNPGGPAGTR